MPLTLADASRLSPLEGAVDPAFDQWRQKNEIEGSPEVVKGWKAAGLGSQASALYTQALKAQIDGDQQQSDVLRAQAQDLDQQTAQWAPRVQNVTDVRSLRDGADWLGGAMGNLRTSVAPAVAGLAGSAVGLAAAPFTGGIVNPMTAGFAAASAAGYDMETDEAVANAMRDPNVRALHTPEEILAASRVKGGINAMLEAAVPTAVGGQILGRAAKGVVGAGAKGAAATIGKTMVKDAAGEFMTEGSQSLVGQGTQNYLLDQDVTGFDYKQAFNEGAAGAVAGGGMGMVGGAAEVMHDRIGAGTQAVKDTAKDVAADPVGKAADLIADAGGALGKGAAKALDWYERSTSEPHKALDSLVGSNIAPELVTPQAMKWAQFVMGDKNSTPDELADAKDFVTRVASGDIAAAEDYRNKLTVKHFETKQAASDTAISDEIAERTGLGAKQSRMRTSLVPFGDEDATSYVFDEQGRATEEGYPPVDLTGLVSDTNTELSPTRTWRSPEHTARVKELNATASAPNIGTFDQPKGGGLKGASLQKLESVADIWRKQGVSDKLLAATSEVTDQPQRESAISMLGWVARGFKDVDGNVFVPESIVKKYKGKSPEVIKSIAKTAFDQGLIGHAEGAQLPEIMKTAQLQYAEAIAVRDNVISAIPEGLVRDKYAPHAEMITDMLRHVVANGTNKKQEEALLSIFGSKEAIAQAMSKLKEPKNKAHTFDKDTDKKQGTSIDADGTTVDEDGDQVFDGDVSEEEQEYETGMSVSEGEKVEPVVRGRNKDNEPFDIQNPRHKEHLDEQLGKAGDAESRKAVGVWDRVIEAADGDRDAQYEGETNLLEQHGAEFLTPAHLKLMEEYDVSVSTAINESQPQVRKAILNKINKRFLMIRTEALKSSAAADAISKDQVSSFEERDVDARGKAALVDHGILFLERDGVKTPFMTSAMRLLKHAWASQKKEQVTTNKGVGVHGVYQDMMTTVAALMEADPRFNGKLGYKTEAGGEIKWLPKTGKLPADFKLGKATMAMVETQAKRSLAAGDKDSEIKLATTGSGMRTALAEYMERPATGEMAFNLIKKTLATGSDKAVGKLYLSIRNGTLNLRLPEERPNVVAPAKTHDERVASLKRAAEVTEHPKLAKWINDVLRTGKGEPVENYAVRVEALYKKLTAKTIVEMPESGFGSYEHVMENKRIASSDNSSSDDTISPNDIHTDESVQGTLRAEDPKVKNGDPTIYRDKRGIALGAEEASGAVGGNSRGGKLGESRPGDSKGVALAKSEPSPTVLTPARLDALDKVEAAKDWAVEKLRKGVPAFNEALGKLNLSEANTAKLVAALSVLAKLAPKSIKTQFGKNLSLEQAAAITKRAGVALSGLEGTIKSPSTTGVTDGTASRQPGVGEAERGRTSAERKPSGQEGGATSDKHGESAVPNVGQASGAGNAGRGETGVAARTSEVQRGASAGVSDKGTGNLSTKELDDAETLAGKKQSTKQAGDLSTLVEQAAPPAFAKAKEVAKATGADFVFAPEGVKGSFASRLATAAKAVGKLIDPNGVENIRGKVVYVSIPGASRGFVGIRQLIVGVRMLLDSGAVIRTDNRENSGTTHNAEGEGKLRTALVFGDYVSEEKGAYTQWYKNLPREQSKQSTQTANTGTTKRATKEEQAAAKQHILDTLGDSVKSNFVKHFGDNSSGSWTPGKVKNIIRLALNGDVLGTAYHESLHEFFDQLKKAGSTATQEVLQRVATNPIINRRIERLLADHPAAADQVRNSPEEAAAFMYQFWRAGLLKLGPEGQTLFEKIKSFFAGLLGKVSAEVRDMQHAEEVMQAFSSGVLKEDATRDAVLKALNTNAEAHTAALENLDKAGRDLVREFGKVFFSSEAMLKGTKNKYMRNVAQMFHQETGEGKGDKQALLEATRQQMNIWTNRLENILTAYKTEDLELAREALSKNVPPKDRIAKEIVEKINEFNERMFEYITSRGVKRLDDDGNWVPVQHRADYFRRVWDTDVVRENAEKFKSMLLEHHPKQLQLIADQANAEIKSGTYVEGSASAEQMAKKPADRETVTPEMVADAIIARLLNANGQVELEESTSSLGMSPVATSVNRRTLSWIDPQQFDEFTSKDIVNVMSGYVSSMVKRAEYTRVFGNTGEGLRALVDKATLEEMGGDELVSSAEKTMPAAIKKWKVSKAKAASEGKYFDAPFPTLMSVGLNNHRLLKGDEAAIESLTKARRVLSQGYKAIMAMEGTLGADMAPGLRKLNSALATYQSFRVLPLVLFSSINDVMGVVANEGKLGDAWNTFVSGIKEIKNSWAGTKSDGRDAVRAEEWGTVEATTRMEALGQLYGSMYMTGKARKLSNSFFKWNGMEGFNRGVRIAATVVAENAIKAFKTEGLDKNDAAAVARFEELFGKGFKPENIALDANGDLDIMNPVNQAAVMRWVSKAVMSPNAAHRPIWGSDARMASVWMLKQFAYTFHRVMLKNAVAQAKLGNLRPALVMAVGYAPVAIAADVVKEALIPGDDPPWMKMGLGSYLQHGVSRAGLFGVPGMIYDAAVYDYGVGLLGPTASQAMHAPFDPVDKTMLGALPAGGRLKALADE